MFMKIFYYLNPYLKVVYNSDRVYLLDELEHPRIPNLQRLSFRDKLLRSHKVPFLSLSKLDMKCVYRAAFAMDAQVARMLHMKLVRKCLNCEA